MRTYFGKWTSKEDMIESFRISPSQLDGFEILAAGYDDIGSYEAVAFVLARKDGKLFEVNAYHCSCHGLEQEWKPEETTAEVVLDRLPRSSYVKDSGGTEMVSLVEKILRGELK